MPVKICPNCNQRYVVGFDTCDYIHECNNGNPAIDQEDVVVVGDWEDYTGSGVKAKQAVTMAGVHNELQGQRAEIEDGDDKEADSPRDNRLSTHRQRQHLEFINIKSEGLN